MDRRILRARRLLDEYFGVVLGAVLVLGLVGVSVTYTAYVNPATEVEQVVTDEWSSQGEFTHRATVVNGTDVFDEGDVLRNRRAYLQRIAPRLNGSFLYSYDATGGGDLEANATLTLVLRSVGQAGTDGGEPVEYWRISRPMGTATEESLSPGDQLSVPFSMNVTATAARVDAIEDQLGGTPGETRIEVRTDLDLSGTRNGQQVDSTRTYQANVTTAENVYRVTGTEPVTRSGQQVESTTTITTYGPLRRIGGPVLLLGGLGAGVALLALRWRVAFELTDAEAEWLAYQSARAEFDDWITTGAVSGDLSPTTEVTVDSLEGLVDVAIDSDRRVIEDPDAGACLVHVDGTVYRVEIPGRAERHERLLASDQEILADWTGGDESEEPE
jgi:hypothetical protein